MPVYIAINKRIAAARTAQVCHLLVEDRLIHGDRCEIHIFTMLIGGSYRTLFDYP